MNVVIVGYGRMGRAIEEAAMARGHEVLGIVDPAVGRARAVGALGRSTLRRARVGFEFTSPEAGEANVVALLEAGLHVVSGTTGWAGLGSAAVRRAARRARVGAVIAPNYSVGMTFFYAVVEEAARRYAASGLYDPWLVEWHHRGKADAPSGTAGKLASLIAKSASAAVVTGQPEGRVPAGAVHLGCVRAGYEPGTHAVGFDGEHDAVTLSHRARGRSGFAFGAVLAAEWIVGRRGLHGFEDVVGDLVRVRKRKGGRT